MSDGDRVFIPVPDDAPHPLGRSIWHDERNRAFPIRELLPRTTQQRTQPWWARHRWNQGSEGSCTAYAAAGLVYTSPFRMRQPSRAAMPSYDEFSERSELYRAAQHVDPFPSTPPAEGSSTDAPFKILRDRGQISEWRWVFGMQDLRDTLNAHGPVAVGTWWKWDMFNPDSKGYVSLGGGNAGGHAYVVLWWDADDDRFRCLNSWYPWGRNNRFWLKGPQMEELLLDGGEAVTIVL